MYRFADCEVDVARRELRRAGHLIHLEPQAFELLVVLLERADEVVSKTDLLDGVWGHRFLSEANVTTRVKEVRRAVGDDGRRQQIVRNLPGHGYRLVAPVTLEPKAAGHSVVADGLIGRDEEVAALLQLLRVAPVVTLTGPGGVGKSTLARAMAKHSAGEYEDGVHLVELAVLHAGEHVLPTVARAMSIVLDHDRPELAIRHIAKLDALLVLDNCEHVVDDVAAFLDGVMGLGSRLRVMATSQVRLGLSDEQVVAIHPLSSAPASQLFSARARAVQPGWSAGAIGPDRIAALLAGLDQLPLTIEMAAARLGSMTFDELEAALSQGAPLLQVSHRSPAHRHRSLASLAAWSAALLEPADRQTLTELAVFAGAVTAADAAAVVAHVVAHVVVHDVAPAVTTDGSAIAFQLARLVERSLLVADADGATTCYRMLSTVRAVAGGWLDDLGGAEAVRRRHAEHYASVVREVDRLIRTPAEAEGRRRLDAVVSEVRIAHRWAQQHDPALAAQLSGSLHLASYSTFWNEPAEWARMLLAGAPNAAELFGAHASVAGAAANRGELGEARAAAMVATQATNPAVRATAFEILADVGLYQGDLGAVAEWADELHRLGTELGDMHSIAIAAVDAALAMVFAGEPAAAIERLEALDLAMLSPTDRAWVAYTRGEALSATTGAAQDAVASYHEAIALASGAGTPFVVSVAQSSLATEYSRAGAQRQAIDIFANCLRDYSRHGNFVHAVTSLRNLVVVLVAIGEDRGATILGAAATNPRLRPSYGTEWAQLDALLSTLETRVGPTLFAEWSTHGRRLDVDQALNIALELVEQRRS